MEQAICNPSEIPSFSINESILDLNKKRKLQADLLGLPTSKHKCWNHRKSPKPLDVLQENKLVDGLTARFASDEAEEPSIYHVSEPAESAEDSNSFVTHNDYSMSESSDVKFESNSCKKWCSTATSGEFSCTNVGDYQVSEVTATAVLEENKAVYEVEDYDPCNYFDEIVEYENLNAASVEVDGIGRLESFKSLSKTIRAKRTCSGVSRRSSGSGSVNQDGGERGRKPTIDQEFEQYFSTLML